MDNPMKEICGNCGCTFGSHHAGQNPWPYNYCPGHEGRMDWEKGPGTVFESTGIYKEEKEKRMISERTLKQWRREALTGSDVPEVIKEGTLSFHLETKVILSKRILRMTQELLDLHLLKK